MKISFIVPSFNEEGNIIPFTQRVREVFPDGDYEIIFVNDGSRDGTLKEIREVMAENREKIRAVTFSRNFGKEAAMLAGLERAKGERCAIIDADLQQDPSYVAEMSAILDENPDIDAVAAYQANRKEGAAISAIKGAFYKAADSLTDVNMENNASDFRLFRRNVAEALLSVGDYRRFSKGLFPFAGFNTVYIPYEVKERNAGESKWSFYSLLKYALSGIISFSAKPLKLPGVLALITFLWFIGFLIEAIIYGFTPMNFIYISMLLLFSLVFLCLRIMGAYLADTYFQGKKRPIYIVKTEEENSAE